MNRVKLIILGVPDTGGDVFVCLKNGWEYGEEPFPSSGIVGQTIEECRNGIFQSTTGLDPNPAWINFSLLDCKTEGDGVSVYYSCLMSVNFAVKDCAFVKVDPHSLANLTESTFNLIEQASYRRY